MYEYKCTPDKALLIYLKGEDYVSNTLFVSEPVSDVSTANTAAISNTKSKRKKWRRDVSALPK